MPTFVRCFKKINCIGDSLTAGVFNTNGTPSSEDISEYSYPTQLAKITGTEVSNFGQGSTTASYDYVNSWEKFADVSGREWLSDSKKGDLYIIALGTNDITALGSFTGNVNDDIDLNNYANNAPTSVGGYARIIQRILAIQPKAVIMCVTIPNSRNVNDSAERTDANNKIKTIANKFPQNCYVIDVQTYAEQEGAEVAYYRDV